MIISQEVKFNGQNFKVKLRDQVDKSVLAEIFTEREYRACEEIIKQAKYPILDVGSHVGFFILYCRALSDKAEIYGLEPEPDNFKVLSRNLKDNQIKAVKIFQQALDPLSDHRQLYLAEDNHNHSVLEISLEKIEKSINVQTINLRDFCAKNKIKRLSLIKLDIEGAEYEILEKIEDKDWQLIEAIILEYHEFKNEFRDLNHRQLENILRTHGFSVQIFPSSFQKNLGFILARNKKLT